LLGPRRYDGAYVSALPPMAKGAPTFGQLPAVAIANNVGEQALLVEPIPFLVGVQADAPVELRRQL